jgi:hypothetical protein
MLEAIHRSISCCHKSAKYYVVRSTDHETPHYVTLYFCITFSVFFPNSLKNNTKYIHTFSLWAKFGAFGVKALSTSLERFKEYK